MAEANDLPPVLDVRDLRIDFRTQAGLVRIIHGVSFAVGAREIVSLVGESGSGKSLSMLAAIGLIGDANAVISGSIRYKGRELIGLAPRDLRRVRGQEIAMIFQDPMTAMTPVHSIGAQIVEQIRAHERVSSRAAKARAISLFAGMGMPDAAAQFHRYPHQLSGGLRQRAMIAMALSCNPSLLIADEPTTALDVTVQAQILDLLDRMRHEYDSSIVLITHDMGVVAELADRVMVMYAGRIVERGAVATVFAKPGHPYTSGLLSAIPPIDGARPLRLAAIDGAPPSPFALPQGCPFQPRCAWRFGDCVSDPPLLPYAGHHIACHLARVENATAV